MSWSADGRYVVTGEQGHKPLVRIWEYSSLRELVSLAGHTHGIEYVRFHPDQNYVISVGAEHDKSVFVWCWRSQTKIGANNKTFKVIFCSIIIAYCLSGNKSDFCVTLYLQFYKFDIQKTLI